MTTTAEKIKVMQAFEDGVEIQSMSRRSSVWCDTPSPSWDWIDNNYRIKPADPKPLREAVMTTTADTILLTEKDKQRLEKIIEVSKAALEGQEIECFEYNGANKSWHQANCVCWNWRDYDYRIKPPDPEPLECWGVLDADGRVCVYKNKKEHAEEISRPVCPPVHMRQVTPQMEQNDLDAARYRWLIANGYTDKRVLWANISEWDELIDKAMEE